MKHNKIIFLVVIIAMLVISGTTYAQDAGKTYTIGLLNTFPDSVKAKMAELGYVEGENVTFLTVSWEGYDTMAPEEFAAALQDRRQMVIDAKPDVFVVDTDSDAVLYLPLTGDTPVVFAISDDPMVTGAVADLVSPGGTITGIVSNSHHPRRLQLLTEIKPSTKHVYYLYYPLTLESETILQQVTDLANDLGVEITPAPVVDLASGLEALENAPDDIDWLFTTPYLPFDQAFADKLIEVSESHQAGIAGFVASPTKGYVINYGPDLYEVHAQTGVIVDRILRGANPGDLPIQIAENRLIVNLEAAEAINLEIPVSVLRQANNIVRPGYFDNLDAFGQPIEEGDGE